MEICEVLSCVCGRGGFEAEERWLERSARTSQAISSVLVWAEAADHLRINFPTIQPN